MDYLVNNFLSYYEYDDYYGFGYLFYCSEIENLPTIDVLFGGYWMEMLADDYVFNWDDSICGFCISQGYYDDEAHLGSAFMRGWYVVHDYDNERQGIAPLAFGLTTGLGSTTGGKAAPVEGTVPSCTFDDTSCQVAGNESSSGSMFVTLLLVIIFLLLSVIGILIYFFYI